MNTKKIAVICNYELLPERVGGMDCFFWKFDKECNEMGIAVDWFFPNISSHGNYKELTIHASGANNLESYFLKHLWKNNEEYTHIFTHFLELCTPFFYQIKRQSIARIIAVDHNPRPLQGYPLMKKIKKRVKGLIYGRNIDVFVGVSAYTVTEIIKDFGPQLRLKTKVVYNGIAIDAIKQRAERAAAKPRFLTASHLRYSKGIQDLIQAVYLLPETIKNEITVAVYGDGPFKTQLQSQVQSLGLEKCFTFMGSTPELQSIYCHYDYLLQPTHMECFSLSILESLAANVPVITTNVGGNEEAVANGQNGFVFEAKNSHQLRDLLYNLWYGKVAIEGNTRPLVAENFTIEKMVGNYITLLK